MCMMTNVAVLTLYCSCISDIKVGFLGQPQLAHEEVNVTVAILEGQLQDGVEVGVALDHKYLQLNGKTVMQLIAVSYSILLKLKF